MSDTNRILDILDSAGIVLMVGTTGSVTSVESIENALRVAEILKNMYE